jgi:hypothetical protein
VVVIDVVHFQRDAGGATVGAAATEGGERGCANLLPSPPA